MSRAVVMFAKAPVPGHVKTRLGATIGDEAAAALHAAFLADLAETLRGLDATLYLAFSGDPEHPGFESLRRAGFTFIEQGEGDLGDRLERVTHELLNRHDALVVIGSDSPTLQPDHFHDAFDALDAGTDIVYGPSFDGGYYLVALKAAYSVPFRDIPWSKTHTLQVSWQRCVAAGLRLELLSFWYDVDNLDDLRILQFHLTDVLCHNADSKAPATLAMLKTLESSALSSET